MIGKKFAYHGTVNHGAKEYVRGIDYKAVEILKKYIPDRGKITPRRITGTCAFHQRKLALAVKRARLMALLPYVED